MFYSQEEIGISESTYKELTGKAYGLSGKEIVIGIEDQNYQREEKVLIRFFMIYLDGCILVNLIRIKGI